MQLARAADALARLEEARHGGASAWGERERGETLLVSVLATPGTVKRQYTRDLIRQWASKCHVRLVGSGNLAPYAERHMRGEAVDDAAILAEIAPAFVHLALQDASGIHDQYVRAWDLAVKLQEGKA